MRNTTMFGVIVSLGLLIAVVFNQESPACTSIMVGKKASRDGSVLTSHTCDSHRTGSDIVVVPANVPAAGLLPITRRTVHPEAETSFPFLSRTWTIG